MPSAVKMASLGSLDLSTNRNLNPLLWWRVNYPFPFLQSDAIVSWWMGEAEGERFTESCEHIFVR